MRAFKHLWNLGTIVTLFAVTGRDAVAQRSDEVFYAVDFAAANPSTKTGGIQEAVDACQSGYLAGRHGCTIVLPRGEVTLQRGIVLGGLSSTRAKDGIVFRGHGSGQHGVDGPNLGGTTLVWSPDPQAAAMPMLALDGVSWSRFENFSLYGSGTANWGIRIRANNPNPSNPNGAPSQQNVFQNVYVGGILGSPGHAVELIGENLQTINRVPKYNDEVSETVFDHLFVNNSKVCFFEDSTQATDIHITNSNFQFYTYGIYLNDGALITTNADFNARKPGDPNGASTADVYVSSSAGDFTAFRNYHETYTGSTYIFDNTDRRGGSHTCGTDGECRTESTVLVAPRVLILQDMCKGDAACATPAQYVIRHLVSGPLTVTGGNFVMFDATQHAPISVEGRAPADTSVSTAGNVYGKGIVWKVSGRVNLVGQDGPISLYSGSYSPLFPPQSSSAMDLWKTGLVLGGDAEGTLGSIVFTDPNHQPRFSEYYSSSMLALNYHDPSTSQLSAMAFMVSPEQPFWFTGGGSHVTKLAVDPTDSDETVTLRNKSGTLLVSGQDGLYGDVGAAFAAGRARATIQPHVITPSRLDGSPAPGQSPSLASSGDHFTWTDVVTPEGPQALAGKDLTSATNTFPPTGVLTFTTGAAVSSNTYCALNNATACNTTTESAVSIGVPALTVKGLWCKATAAPGGAGKTWTFRVVKNGTGTVFANCDGISNMGTSCSDTTTSLQFAAGDTISLQFVATNSPASATVFCSLGVSPPVPSR